MSFVMYFSVALAASSVCAAELCDLTVNPGAQDGHTPADPERFFTVCSSSRYEAHPSTVMLSDDKTILAFWDVRQGGPCGSAAISKDAGRSWTRIDGRLPEEFLDCHDEPKAWRFLDPKTGRDRIRVFASYGTADEYDWRGPASRPQAEAMPSILSEDGGVTWRYLPPLGADFACVVGFSGMVRLADGSYLGAFSRGENPNGDGGEYCLMGSFSRDGGMTWEKPFVLAKKDGRSFFMPTLFRAPDGKEICCLAIDWCGGKAWTSFSSDEGKTWSEPSQAIDELEGGEHSVGVLPDGRVVVAFHREDEIRGWIGSYGALRGRPKGVDHVMRIVHNYGDGAAVGSPNVHVRKNGEIIVIAHSQFDLRRPMPAVVAMRFTAEEVAHAADERAKAREDFEGWNPFAGSAFRPLDHMKLYGPFAQEVVLRDKIKREFYPFDGSKAYIAKAAGEDAVEVTSRTGAYEIAKHANRRRGNAAILVWTVRVPEDCTTRLRLFASPAAYCCVGKTEVLSPVYAGAFDYRTIEVSLKKGDNDISVMVYQPKGSAAVSRGFSDMPMRVAAGLELKEFECVRSEAKIEIEDANEVSIDNITDL